MTLHKGFKDKFTLGALIQSFFNERLIRQMNASDNTVCSYRDNLRLFLTYLQSELKCDVSKLAIEDFNANNILNFLNYCEEERKNCIRTRNQRLASFKSFFKYAVFIDPTLLLQSERIMMIPSKNYNRQVLGYLTKTEIEAILATPDRKSSDGRRHYAILQFLYNTGARVSEAINLKVSHVKIVKGASQVLIHGKGSKQRITPIWNETADILLDLISEQRDSENPNASVFKNQVGNTITRSGVRYIVDITVEIAKKECVSLGEKKISPHTFRHTTAMHLLQSGVDINTIRMWLGHVNLGTTHQYIEADTEMKRETLLKGGIIPPTESKGWKPTAEILTYLDSIGK